MQKWKIHFQVKDRSQPDFDHEFIAFDQFDAIDFVKQYVQSKSGLIIPKWETLIQIFDK